MGFSRLRPLPASVVVSTAVALPVFLTGGLAVQIRHDLGFGTAAFGGAVAIYFVAAALSSVPFGRLAERLGSPRTLRWASLGAAGALFGIAAAAWSWASLVGWLVLAGMSSAAAQPAANLLLARAVAPARQGRAFGIKQAAIPLATLLSGLAVPAIALTIGWRWAFAGAGVLALAAGRLVPDVTAAGPAGPARPASLGRPQVLALSVLAAAFALGVGAATALGSFLVQAGVATGLGKGEAGLVAALCSVVGLATRLVVGMAADRRGGRHLPVVAGMLVGGAVGYGLLASGASGLLFVIGGALAFGAGWGWNGLFNFAVVRTHPEAPGQATGVTQAGGRIGGVLVPLAFGLLAAPHSYAASWALTAVMALGAAAMMVWGRSLVLRYYSPAGG